MESAAFETTAAQVTPTSVQSALVHDLGYCKLAKALLRPQDLEVYPLPIVFWDVKCYAYVFFPRCPWKLLPPLPVQQSFQQEFVIRQPTLLSLASASPSVLVQACIFLSGKDVTGTRHTPNLNSHHPVYHWFCLYVFPALEFLTPALWPLTR